jgi:hypothetical protein
VKRLFAILFSALLVLTQSVFANNMPARIPVTNCGCGKHHCCMSKSAPDDKPLPAAPSCPLSLKEWQLVLAVTLQVLSSAALPATEIPPTHIFVSESDATPLYQRNCTYLI